MTRYINRLAMGGQINRTIKQLNLLTMDLNSDNTVELKDEIQYIVKNATSLSDLIEKLEASKDNLKTKVKKGKSNAEISVDDLKTAKIDTKIYLNKRGHSNVSLSFTVNDLHLDLEYIQINNGLTQNKLNINYTTTSRSTQFDADYEERIGDDWVKKYRKLQEFVPSKFVPVLDYIDKLVEDIHFDIMLEQFCLMSKDFWKTYDFDDIREATPFQIIP